MKKIVLYNYQCIRLMKIFFKIKRKYMVLCVARYHIKDIYLQYK